jgi:hypothetical protein
MMLLKRLLVRERGSKMPAKSEKQLEERKEIGGGHGSFDIG